MSITAPWLRLASDFADSPMFDGIDTPGPLLAWIGLLCEAKERGRGGRFTLRRVAFCRRYRVTPEDLERCLAVCVGAVRVTGDVCELANWKRYQDSNVLRQGKPPAEADDATGRRKQATAHIDDPHLRIRIWTAARRAGCESPSLDVVEVYRRAAHDPDVECYWCGRVTDPDERHVDHVVPLSRGGQHEASNLVVSCAKCNREKNSNTRPLHGCLDQTHSHTPTFTSHTSQLQSQEEQNAARSPATAAKPAVSGGGKSPTTGGKTPAGKTEPVSLDRETWEWSGVESRRACWEAAYPAVDIDAELAKAAVWCRENGARGVRKNYGRFLANWLARQQERGGTRGGASPFVPEDPNAKAKREANELVQRLMARDAARASEETPW